MEHSQGARLWLALALTVTAVGLAACGNEDGDEGETTNAAEEAGTTAGGDETGTTAEEGGELILIKTHITFAENPTPDAVATGEVLPGSTISDSAFCVEGTFSDRAGESQGSVVKTIRCSDGRLTITFSPTEPDQKLKQTGDWEVVTGSGSFEGLTGGGEMQAVFESGGAEGRETFTGTITR